MPLEETVRAIRELRIQGAQAIAKAALTSLAECAHQHVGEPGIKGHIAFCSQQLLAARPTEPCLRNALRYAETQSDGTPSSYLSSIAKAGMLLSQAEEQVWLITSHKIANGSVVFTHCHSSTVVGGLAKAWKDGKRFVVHNTETRPFFQGRITAQELAGLGIQVRHFIDAAARLALKKADIMLIGCDAIMSDGRVVNKIGSELIAEVAKQRDIPVYVCTSSWKFDAQSCFGFDTELEQRHASEVWPGPPDGVHIDNHVFEIVNPSSITGVITEFGIFPSTVLGAELTRRCGWMF